MNLPFNKFKAGIDFEEKFVNSLLIEVKYNKQTIRQLEDELNIFSTQTKEMKNDN